MNTNEDLIEDENDFDADDISEEDAERVRQMMEDVIIAKRGNLKIQIKCWVEETGFNEFFQAINERVIGQEGLKDVVACVYIYLKNIAEGRMFKTNVLLAAPSGSGKTETFRALRDYFAVEIPMLPVYQVDLTQVTEEGFKGHDTKYIIQPLVDLKDSDGTAIVFLDEFDKKVLPSYDKTGVNVNAAVQSQILTLIEGRRIVEEVKLDTSNTMFIGCGAFDYVRRERKEASEKHSIGFAREEKDVKHYDEITQADVIAAGASYELIGRFAMFINFHELSDRAVDMIIDKTADKVSEGLGIKIAIGSKMREELHASANTEYGCRRFMSMIQETAIRSYVELMVRDKKPERYEIVLEKTNHAYARRLKKETAEPQRARAV